MASKKVKNVSMFNNVDTIIEKAKTINKEAIKTTDMLVEEGLVTGMKFQKILAKSVTKGTDLLEKQQDMAIENIEEVMNLYVAGTKRFRKLFNIDQLEADVKGIAKKVNKQADKARKTANKAIKNAETTFDEVEDEISDTKKSVIKSTLKIVKEVKAKATSIINKATVDASPKKSATKATRKVSSAKKATVNRAKKKVTAVKKTAVKATAKKTAPKSEAIKKVTAIKATKKVAPVKKTVLKTVAPSAQVMSDLTAIKGIGPKLESMLKGEGFTTVKDIATAKKSDFEAMLEKAGSRYKMFDANVWIENAKAITK